MRPRRRVRGGGGERRRLAAAAYDVEVFFSSAEVDDDELTKARDALKAEAEHDALDQSQKDQALVQAAQNNELQTVERLIAEGVSADAKDGNGVPALSLAAHARRLDALKLLRRHGANLDATDPIGVTALMLAAAAGHAAAPAALDAYQNSPDPTIDTQGLCALTIPSTATAAPRRRCRGGSLGPSARRRPPSCRPP